ncbi:hypothetical protein Ancab_038287 [Ancistrocladus abbreviatus]
MNVLGIGIADDDFWCKASGRPFSYIAVKWLEKPLTVELRIDDFPWLVKSSRCIVAGGPEDNISSTMVMSGLDCFQEAC